MSFISVENVSFHYDNNDPERLITENVIENLNMKVEKGEFLCILGHNGSGKSTLAKMFNAMLIPTEGKVYVDGMDTSDESLCFKIRSNVGLVLQNPDNQLVASVVEDSEAVYVILKADLYERLTDDDWWSENYILNLQNQKYGDEFSDFIDEIAKSYNVSRNERAFKRYEPFSLDYEQEQ